MANRLLKFGSYAFPLGFRVEEDDNGLTIARAKLARADGARFLRGYRNEKRVVVRGGIYNGPFDSSDLRTRIDALRAALFGGPARLWLYDDRYYRCMQAETFPDHYVPTGFNRLADIEIAFSGPDPFQYSSATSTDTWNSPSSGGTRILTSNGNAYAWPTFTITVGGAGSQSIAYTLTNSTTGEAFTLTGTVAGGNVIVVNSLAKTVLIGTTDEMTLFDGIFPTLAAGGNTFTLTISTGSITSIVTTWQDRWI